MKTKLLLLLFLSTFAGFSQSTQTITIDWGFNSTPSASGNANTDRTIEVGDTIEWNWYASGSHNVVSNGGTETFNSGSVTNNPGVNFSFTFNQIGTTNFICSPHSSIMFGTITVVAEGTLSMENFEILNEISIYPNPVKDELTMDIPRSLNEEIKYEIFNVLGNRVYTFNSEKKLNKLNVSNLTSGVYLVRILSKNNRSLIKRFVKQ